MGTKRIKKFEASSAQIQVPLIPAEGKVDFRAPGGKLLVKKATSRDGTIAGAIALKDNLIGRYREKCEQGDADALAELLLYGPIFQKEKWFERGLLKLVGRVCSGSNQRKPGRRQGKGVVDGIRLVALVDLLVGRGKSKRTALKLIQPHLRGTLSFERMKRLYYSSRKSDRLNPILFSRPDSLIMSEKQINSQIGEEMILTREVKIDGQTLPAGGSVLITPVLKRLFPKGSLKRLDKAML